MQEDCGGVIFLSYKTSKGSGYGINVNNGTIDSAVCINILKTSLLDTFDYYALDIKIVRFQQDKATPHTSVITKQ